MPSRFTAPRRLLATVVVSLLAVAACGGKDKAAGDRSEEQHEAKSGAPAASGRVIAINVTTDEKGNYFAPSEIEAKRGDILRFTLVTGVHNVNFLPDSNVGKSGLPPASDLLQLPGQTLDVPVTFAGGTYYFQCDPHAALGMKGHLKVDD
ncbi:MAG: plastocyanin/azurin family copper-binding protein [Gemmatimonadota bacterium]